ncbi:Signal transduction histidine kinase [Lentilactobacillus senioris DSM 24302 = JCM 17472]|uniref:histidine kinase n=1 Tax=Lentilactobacillus senioris DSM 24302 = JCM 17472 TaxID=1423802 RepID=A0A0R2CQV1_9LACO|nr:ATP-binding protein [Lentilactobacillus senioris]KRM93456.1 Signal transduction histidine kinase [Lentilactobacillus senioris DSM 24302 = JCM 17472]
MKNKAIKSLIIISSLNLLIAILFMSWELKHQFLTGRVMLLTIMTLELVGLIVYLLNLSQQIKHISQRANAIASGAERGPVIDPPSSSFYDLNNALNQIQIHQRHQQITVTNITDELVGVLNHLPVGVMVIDQQQNVTLANRAFSQMTEKEISTAPHPFTDDVSNAALLNMINSALMSHQNGHKEITNFQRARTWDAQVVNLEGAVPAVVVILYDITMLVAAKQSQIDFLRNASHELKTPVATIRGFTETLQAGAKDDPETLTDFLQDIENASQQLTDLVNDILVISHVQMQEAGEIEPIELADLVQQEMGHWQLAAESKQVSLTDQIDSQLVVVGNRQALKRIVSNLISNAIKYNWEAGEVMINAGSNTSQWWLEVSDTGIGIEEAAIPRVFERFFRADQSHSNQVVEGTGLGLAIVAELAATYHAHIDITSKVNQGTTIKLTFPVTNKKN